MNRKEFLYLVGKIETLLPHMPPGLASIHIHDDFVGIEIGNWTYTKDDNGKVELTEEFQEEKEPMWTDDPVHDMERYEAKAYAQMRKVYPICEWCKEPITESRFIDYEGLYYCRECFDELYEKKTADYVREEVAP